MIEAVWYGIIASFSFLGLLSIVFYIFLHIYKINDVGKLVLYINKNIPEHRVIDLIYGSYLRRILFGKMISDEIIVVSDNLDEDYINGLIGVANEFNYLNCAVYKGSLSVAMREEKDGKGNV